MPAITQGGLTQIGSNARENNAHEIKQVTSPEGVVANVSQTNSPETLDRLVANAVQEAKKNLIRSAYER